MKTCLAHYKTAMSELLKHFKVINISLIKQEITVNEISRKEQKVANFSINFEARKSAVIIKNSSLSQLEMQERCSSLTAIRVVRF